MEHLRRLKARIGPEVRRLRMERRWTLAELAGRLGLSVSRLSEIERGDGSFSAEHLLVIFELFHVGPEHFPPRSDGCDPVIGSLQIALHRLGAVHLTSVENAVLRQEHERAAPVVQGVLIEHPSARFLTSLPPVLIARADQISFPSVQHAVVQAGVPHRWGWLLEHFVDALDAVQGGVGSVRWRRASKRAQTVAESFLPSVPRPEEDAPYDLLDPDLRSTSGVRDAEERASGIDRRWRVLSRLRTVDFVQPLEVLRDAI
jgi:transcriptional regulator with XRE-family HTH domain